MIGIIMFIVGIFYGVRRSKIRKLAAQDFPAVDAAKFLEWQHAELKGVDIVLWVTWIAFALSFIPFILPSMLSDYIVFVALVAAWLCGLIIATIFGNKAKKLRTAASIMWPKK